MNKKRKYLIPIDQKILKSGIIIDGIYRIFIQWYRTFIKYKLITYPRLTNLFRFLLNYHVRINYKK